MQSQEEITAAHWHKETQKRYIRIAMLTLLGKKPYHGYEIAHAQKKRCSHRRLK
jgi:DNA-binding PadR family transcriptional regulator